MIKTSHFEKVIGCLPPEIKRQLDEQPPDVLESLEEIRIYKQRPAQIFAAGRRIQLNGLTAAESINSILNSLMKFSYYAYEEDIGKGFITIDGGHRVGICGKAVVENGCVRLIREVSSLNIRYSREVPGCSEKIQSLLTDPETGCINNILIASPPGCGKTTLLRDIARCLSQQMYKVAICDERSEIAGVCNGLSPYSFGPMVDILDGCPKAQGMIMLIRSMSPDVVITDEIGRAEDIEAIEACINSGVSIITSVHGKTAAEINRGISGHLISKHIFNHIIILTNSPKTGTVREVIHV